VKTINEHLNRTNSYIHAKSFHEEEMGILKPLESMIPDIKQEIEG